MASGSENAALVNELARRLNDNTRRIRVLEEKVRNLETQMSGHDQRIMDANKEANSTTLVFAEELSSVKERLAVMAVDIQGIRTELKKTAQKPELREIQDYIDLINPIATKFVTKGEVEEMVRQEIRRQGSRRV